MSDQPRKVIFAGTPEFAISSLKALIVDPAFDVIGVITQPDKKVGRKQILTPPPIKAVAEQNQIPIWQPKKINTEWPDRQSPFSESYDFLVVVAYGQILKQDILDSPSIAPVNVHASLLPRWRGASPMQHALLADDAHTGITIQRMAVKLDSGPILSQERTDITDSTTIESMHDELAAEGAKLLVETLKNPITEIEQEEQHITICHKLSRKSGNVDPASQTASEIERTIRALVPWPGVRCDIDGDEVKLLEVLLEETENSIPLECKDSTLHIVTLQPPGKKPMSAKSWKRGRQ